MASGSAAGTALGLIQQVADETDEERRRRLIAAQSQRLLPNSGSAAGNALGRLNAGYGSILSGY